MRRLILSMLFSLVAIAAGFAQTLTVNAPSAVAVGNRFRIEFEADGRATDMRCEINDPNVDVLYGPTSSVMSSSHIINGSVSSSIKTTFTYTLLAKAEGTVRLPSATCKIDGKTVSSGTASIRILPADDPQANQGSAESRGNGQAQSQQAASGKFNKDDVHLELELSKTSAYEGEALVATLKIYYRNCNLTNVTDAKTPDFNGFISQEVDLGASQQVTLERYRNANYSMYPLAQWLLFPQKAGEATIDASSLTAIVQYVVVRRSGGFFDFPMETAEQVQCPVKTSPRKVSVKTLPANRPAGYGNGVGEFTIKSELTSNRVKANDAIIYRLTIDGIGNLKYLKDPQPEFPADFEVYDPKSDLQATTTLRGVRGKRVIEYTVIPRFGGTFQIPAVQFSYFDIKSGQYKTLTTEAYTLEVEKSADGGQRGATVSDYGGTTQERIRELGSDIRYIHAIDADTLRPEQKPFFRTFGWWLFILCPALAFAVLAVVYRRQLKLNANLALKRTRKAGKVAGRRLKEAAAALKAGQEQPFYEALHKAMLGYVSDKLNIPLSELSTENVRTQLLEHRVNEETVGKVIELVQTCEFARYAPSGDASARTDLYRQASDLLDALESQIRK